MKKILKITYIILIQVFLNLNISQAAGVEYADRKIYSKDTLSPALQINNDLLKARFNANSFLLSTPEVNDNVETLPKPSFLLEEWSPAQNEQISPVKNRRNKTFIMQVPVFSGRQGKGRFAGIGKLTNYAQTCKKYNQATGANAFMGLPIHSTLDDVHSPYAPASNHAINELLIDWDDIIDRFFPHLIPQKPPYLEQKGYIDYVLVEKRDAVLAAMVFAEFEKQAETGALAKQVQEFKEIYGWWLNDYCQFRALTDMFDKKPWWQWPAEQIQAVQQKSEYRQKVNFYALSQFAALLQWQEAVKEIHSFGGKILYDKPYFCAKNSVEVWTSFRDNKGYFLGLERSPGVKGRELQIYYTLACYSYTNLRNNSTRPYELILKDHEYKLDVLGFDGGRLDSGHSAYPWTEEWLRSGDEPGDEFLLAIKDVYNKRGNPLLIVEQLGSRGDIMDRIKGLGFITMEELIWNRFPQGNVMVSLTSHDQDRVGVRYGDASEGGYKREFKYLFATDAPIIYLTVGEEIMDHNRINNPYLSPEDRMKFNWRYLIPHPLDPDYNERMKSDLTSYIRSLSAEYLGNWDEMFYQEVERGRALKVKAEPETLEILKQRISFTPRYDSGKKELPAVTGSVKEIFKLLYREFAQNPVGEKSLLHHAHKNDLSAFAEYILGKIPGLEKRDFQAAIDQLKNPDIPEYKLIAANIRLLGLLSGFFEQIEKAAVPEKPEFSAELEFSSRLERDFNPEPALAFEQAI